MSDLDDAGNLVLTTGEKVPKLTPTSSMFVDRSVAIYGPSGTGKTVIVKNIMKLVSDHIEQILVISPSEPTNRSYEGFVDPPFIHYRMYLPDPKKPDKDDGAKGALRFLQAIWKRQEMMASIYKRANNGDILAKLYSRLPKSSRADGLKYIETINAKRGRVIARVKRQYSSEPGRLDEKVKDINEKFKKMLVLLYKKYITPAYESLWERDDLSEDERYSLYYLTFNPRLLIIFDDCAAQLKPLFNKEVFRLLFYQGRHSFITTLICAQDDTDLPANIRKSAFVSFFTTEVVCLSNFERQANKFPKPEKKYVANIVGEVFGGEFRKLAYIREDERRKHYYHVKFPYPRPFLFGSAASHELCKQVQSTGVTMDKDNPFYNNFRI